VSYSSEQKEVLACGVLGRTAMVRCKKAEGRKLACCDWVRVGDVRWQRGLQKLPGLYARAVSISSINDALRRRTMSSRLGLEAWRAWSPANSVQQRRATVPDVLRLLSL